MKKFRKITFFMILFMMINSFSPLTVYSATTSTDVSSSVSSEVSESSSPETTEKPPLYDSGIDFTEKAVYVENLTTGNVVIDYNTEDRLYPASVTKTMTVLLVLENVKDLTETETAIYSDFDDMNAYGSTAGIMYGETMSIDDMLHCIMISSANEACNIIARHVAGSIDKFVQMMNARAEELGCTNTHFCNPHGLHDDNHYSCAGDIAKIIKEALKHDKFRELCGLTSYTVPATNKSGERKLNSTNYLIVPTQSKYYYKYAKGIKTGFTTPAGACLASYAEKDGTTYLSVMLGGIRDEDKTNHTMLDTKAVFEWAFENLEVQDLLNTSTKVTEVPVGLSWDTDFVSLVPEKNISYLVPKDFNKDLLEKVIDSKEKTDAPVAVGDVLGSMLVKYDGKTLGTVNLVAQSAVEQSSSLYAFSKIESFVDSVWFRVVIIGAIVLIILYIILAVLFNKRRKNRRRSAPPKKFTRLKQPKRGSRYR